MAILSLAKLIDLISTSQAVYEDLSKFELLEQILASSDSFTKEEADEFVKRYEIANKAKLESTPSGFQAILFYDKIDHKNVLAIRGSEQIGQDFAYADGGDISRFGFAAGQAADLYRYWKKLTTPEGQVVTYSDQERLQLFLLTVGSASFLVNLALSLSNIGDIKQSAEYVSFLAGFKNDVGLGAISASTKVDVTGHSLGGNLAEVFASMFPENVSQVVTINAPSLNGGQVLNGQLALKLLGFSFANQSQITSVTGEGDTVHFTSGAQIGTVVNISQEVGHGVVDGVNNNHSVINALDSLNLMNLFAKLDTSQANNPSGILVDIMKASSNQMNDSFEIMLDGLRRTLLGTGITPTKVGDKGDIAARNELYNNMDELSQKFADNGSFVLSGNTLTNLTQASKDSIVYYDIRYAGMGMVG